ncbi:MAG: hypothetical protein QXO84_04020 [Candidatus Aenigmatarchaeota archaeon]
MLKKVTYFLIFLLFLNLSHSLELNCGYKNFYGKCIMGETCSCVIEGCNDGNLLVFENNITQPLCFPKIKDGNATIFLETCAIGKQKINVVALCNGEQSDKKTIEILLEKPSKCIWNETSNKCQQNPDPLAERCQGDFYCVWVDEDKCECLKVTTIVTTTIKNQTTYISTTTSEATTTTTLQVSQNKPCPYECCENIKGYEDLLCEEGYVCCKKNNNYYCKKGNSCFEQKKASGAVGFLVFLLILVFLGVIVFAVYYMKKTRVNIENKYNLKFIKFKNHKVI